MSAHVPLKISASASFQALLAQQRISLLVSTYQAGKLMILRADRGRLNVHFRSFKKAMGLAANRMRLAVGTAHHIHELYNLPAVAAKLDPPSRHDACYVPRNSHVTGDIDIHEMGWAEDELWFVNTRFSCLCTLDMAYSFVPRWRPLFISAYAAEDRCHLNGLAIAAGQPRYVSALGQSDRAQGWREHKATGGLLIDVQNNSVIAQGLSMPHSPRWYQDRLWVLESGQGSLATVDLASGQLSAIAHCPGFTRGLDFAGTCAFIGLSQVRESAVFSDLPLTERLQSRICGIWVVNITTGQTLAQLEFESGVEEIFAVQVLQNVCFPEILPADDPLVGTSYALPPEALAEVKI
ncbi:MAG: TIGR03032 family protein [Leptolyngbya sp. SIO4C1]|nr:TIGR03032 family protein [Leptolyngbya sp. SIO4C1]